MNYYEKPLEKRLQQTLLTLSHCTIKTVKNKKERDEKDKYMLNKLQSIWGKAPEGDWRAWSVCSCCARIKGSKDYCTNPDHWFLYNADSKDEKQQLRDLRTNLIIRDLPTGQKRYLTNLQNDTHNFYMTVKCEGCKEDVTTNQIKRHKAFCKAYQSKLKAKDKHEMILNAIKTSENASEVIVKLLENTVTSFVEKSLLNEKEIEYFTKQYTTAVNEVMTLQNKEQDALVSDLQNKIDQKSRQNANLSARVRELENKLYALSSIISGDTQICVG